MQQAALSLQFHDLPTDRPPRWQFWVDRGGTFTDIVALQPDGKLVTHKLLSENPEYYADAAVAGIRYLLGVADGQPIDASLIDCVKMGTTVATNALLERKGAPTLLCITKGFHDALRIAYQNRPRLFDLQIQLPELLYRQVIEVDERLNARGEVLQALDTAKVLADLQTQYAAGYRAIAIVLMHAWCYPQHEAQIAELARQAGFTQISTSHQISPLMKLVARGDTTVVDAYLSPVLRHYVNQVAKALPGVNVQFMQSNGGLTAASHFQGKDSILSGPAGGIVGMVRSSLSAGFNRIIGFDMGGTSTDVSHFKSDHFDAAALSEMERSFDTQIAGVRMRVPMLSIHTVAAGGGSIVHFDGERLRIGPDSAGANPGPASYRRGGPLTVTDCNVLLGKIVPAHFPHVFGAMGNEPLDRRIVMKKMNELSDTMSKAHGKLMTWEMVAEGALQIAVANMANAIKQISVARGHDVSNYVLTTFGGAGGQHACLVADALGMKTVFAHPLAGVLSAYGMGLANQSAMREATVELPFVDGALLELEAQWQKLSLQAVTHLQSQGIAAARIQLIQRARLRYVGSDSVITVLKDSLPNMQQQFEAIYQQRFALLMSGTAIWFDSLEVEAVHEAADVSADLQQRYQPDPLSHIGLHGQSVRMYSAGRWRDAILYPRANLQPGHHIPGPAIIAEDNATTVVEVGWQAEVTAQNNLVLRRVMPLALPSTGKVTQQQTEQPETADPVLLEVFNNLFMSIAEQMGARLQSTAYSVNIKERLDFSCAIFDAQGNLIANAPHMPVHLGSMGESIKTIIMRNEGCIQAGDVFALNDPYAGGTHLPDVTVITPVFDEAGQALLFYVASRGHHADIGGITPGSMPPHSIMVQEEGVLLDNLCIMSRGELHEAELRRLLTTAPYPARNVEQNLADLRAQIAANQKGCDELLAMVSHYSLAVVQAYMQHVQDNAERAVRLAIKALPLNKGSYRYQLDNGAVIVVQVSLDKDRGEAVVDFTGTSAQLPNNFNAPRAVCMAAVLYVFRTLVNDDMPLNAGCLKPIKVIIPEGSMLNPNFPAAVVSGNVETSSCITNALYGALQIMAASQGTMNNFTFGNAQYQYYETIAGGAGAGNGFAGCDVVQTHMTNSRLTDPEVLEWRYPVLLESYAIRPHSGGAGQWSGGNGGVRRVRFLETMTASILSNNRLHAPFGMARGADGATGYNRVIRANGQVEALQFVDSTTMQPGDVFEIGTPGGGGYGAAV